MIRLSLPYISKQNEGPSAVFLLKGKKLLTVHPNFPLTKKNLHHYDLTIMKKIKIKKRILASCLGESVSMRNYFRYRSSIPASSQRPDLASWEFLSLVNFSSVFFCFMYFHFWADTSTRHASVVVHAIFMAQEVAESSKKQAHMHTAAHTLVSESRRVPAKG